MIIDCFTFYNEFDMLECRLEYLYDHVDYFVLSECNFTHSGKPKPMYYAENMDRYSRFNSKIIYTPYIVDRQKYNFDLSTYTPDMLIGQGSDYWKIENQQRDNILQGLHQFTDDTVVLISDLDEIPNVNLFFMFNENLNLYKIIYFDLIGCQYNLKYQTGPGWARSFVTTKEHVAQHTPNRLRNSVPDMVYPNGGWHLSYFMTPEQIKNKIENFAHQEFNTPYWTDINRIADCIANNKDIIDRASSVPDTPREFYPESFMKTFGRFYP